MKCISDIFYEKPKPQCLVSPAFTEMAWSPGEVTVLSTSFQGGCPLGHCCSDKESQTLGICSHKRKPRTGHCSDGWESFTGNGTFSDSVFDAFFFPHALQSWLQGTQSLCRCSDRSTWNRNREGRSLLRVPKQGISVSLSILASKAPFQ